MGQRRQAVVYHEYRQQDPCQRHEKEVGAHRQPMGFADAEWLFTREEHACQCGGNTGCGVEGLSYRISGCHPATGFEGRLPQCFTRVPLLNPPEVRGAIICAPVHSEHFMLGTVATFPSGAVFTMVLSSAQVPVKGARFRPYSLQW